MEYFKLHQIAILLLSCLYSVDATYKVKLVEKQDRILFGNDVNLQCSIIGEHFLNGTWQIHKDLIKVSSNGDVNPSLSQKYMVSIESNKLILMIAKFSEDDLEHTMKCSYGAEEASFKFVLNESKYTYLPKSNNVTVVQKKAVDGFISITVKMYFDKVYPVPKCWISLKGISKEFSIHYLHEPHRQNKLYAITFEHQLLSRECMEKVELICDIGFEKNITINQDTTVNCSDTGIFNYSQTEYGVTFVIISFSAILVLILLAFFIFNIEEATQKYWTEKQCSLKLAVYVFCITVGSSFLYGFNLSIVNLPAQISGFEEGPWAWVVSSYACAGFGGSALMSIIIYCLKKNNLQGSYIYRHLTRITCITAYIIGVVASVLAFCITEEHRFEWILAHRCIMGFSSGMSLKAGLQFLKEIAPDSMKDTISKWYQLSITCGIFFGNVLSSENILGSPEDWKVLFGLTIIPSIVSIAAIIFHCITEENCDPDAVTGTYPQDKKKNKLACYLLQICQQICGINIIMCYSSSIFITLGVGTQQKEVAVTGTSGINVIITAIAVFMVNKFARKTMLILPLIMMILAFGGLPLVMNFVEPETRGGYGTILINLYVIGFALSLGPLPYMMIGEKYFQRAMTLNWLVNFAVLSSFPYMQSSEVKGLAFIVYAVFVVMSSMVLYKFVHENNTSTGNVPKNTKKLLLKIDRADQV
ncbi:solute carrier family 2, facilitated glucose transporter member 5-like [Mytilus galloprovincialis]|uniref:solute carrier family 2, facilitated glucose transporter member 5-like n=1 Tax=Mytilus galloprovincialis TaxID=29158 RepID=UPI003F7B904F